jgi:outer membrane protein OmpA-like peptidoglycan-associated protein
MNNSFHYKTRCKTLIAAGVVSALLAACSAAPQRPDGADRLRSELTELQSNSELASRAPLAIKEADIAVSAAEQPQADQALAAHLVFMADRKIGIARALGESRLAVDQRKSLSEEREARRLQARTEEADSANRRAAVAQADASYEKQAADAARDQADADRNAAQDAARDQADAARDAARDQADSARDAARDQADSARDAAADAALNAQELQRQIDDLQAKVTDRGLVLTLGDVLFASGTAQLNSGGTNNLGKLAGFLNKHPERTALIEGHTDSVGSEDYNQGLSQRRADAVKSYLVGQSISSSRLSASGKGEYSPIGDNSSATGRQQNRRVEVIIENNMVSSK